MIHDTLGVSVFVRVPVFLLLPSFSYIGINSMFWSTESEGRRGSRHHEDTE